MNIGLKIIWNNPIGVNYKINQSSTVININFGSMILNTSNVTPVISTE